MNINSYTEAAASNDKIVIFLGSNKNPFSKIFFCCFFTLAKRVYRRHAGGLPANGMNSVRNAIAKDDRYVCFGGMVELLASVPTSK